MNTQKLHKKVSLDIENFSIKNKSVDKVNFPIEIADGVTTWSLNVLLSKEEEYIAFHLLKGVASGLFYISPNALADATKNLGNSQHRVGLCFKNFKIDFGNFVLSAKSGNIVSFSSDKYTYKNGEFLYNFSYANTRSFGKESWVTMELSSMKENMSVKIRK